MILFKTGIVRLPNLVICTDSMHSKRKVQLKYPQLNHTVLEQLYGLHTKGLKRNMWDIRKKSPEIFLKLKADFEKEYAELNALNLTQFYKDTVPAKIFKVTIFNEFCMWPLIYEVLKKMN